MLYHSPISELHNVVEAGSVDIILTDPPYPKEYLHTWEELAVFAEHALADGGHLLAMSGNAWLPKVFARLESGSLKYQWTLEVRMGVHSCGCIGRRVFLSRWKPIIWYTKGKNTVPPIIDMLEAGVADKRYHEWGQNVSSFSELLRRFHVDRNSTVCDPFVGGGTSAIAALENGCKFIGADIDEECIKTTQERCDAYLPDLLSLESHQNQSEVEAEQLTAI